MKISFLLVLVLFAFVGCQNPTDTNAPKNYFNLKGFIGTQIKELEKRKPLVNKMMTLGEATENKSTTEIDWTKELELFTQADLNKQAYQLSYEISTPIPNTFVYSLKKGEKLPVKLLKVVIDAQSNLPNLVEATFREENELYDSEKKLALTCSMRPEGIWLVKTYAIGGFQHLTLTEKKLFLIEGIVQ